MTAPIDLEALRSVLSVLQYEACTIPFDSRDYGPQREQDVADIDAAHRTVQLALAELTTRRARDAEVEALVAADLELDRAIDAAGGFVEEGYEADSYGVHGSDFERCLACDAESGAGVLNKGVTHEADCVRHRYEVALERRAEALAPFTGAKP
jgi:DNA-binding GntR family transcriptional regulator